MSSNVTSDLVVVQMDKARQALAEATTIQETNQIKNMAASAEVYAKRQQLGKETIQYAHAIQVEALRQLGHMLKNTEKATGGQPYQSSTGSKYEPVAPTLSDLGLDKKTSSLAQKIADLPDDQFDKVRAGVIALSSVAKASFHVSDGTDDWNTPKEVIQLARQVLGGIDIDPASNPTAQEIVQAGKHYTEADDGLLKTWQGRLWLNPPYSMPHIRDFTEKAIEEYEAGNVTAGLVLINNATDTGWFHNLLGRYPACFFKRRLQFWNGGGEILAARQGQVLFYMGSDIQAFASAYSQLGEIMVRYDN